MSAPNPVHINRGLAGLLCCVALGAAGCGSQASSSSTPASSTGTPASSTGTPALSGTVAVAYRNIAIHPAQITIKAGTTVKWTNFDGGGIEHNVTVQSGPQTFSSASLTHGQSYTFKFLKPGVYHYVCTFHPASMIGTVTVK